MILNSDTITFPNGMEPGSVDCFNVSIVKDGTLEGDEVVSLELSSDDAVVDGNISITISDVEDIEGIYLQFESTHEIKYGSTVEPLYSGHHWGMKFWPI